MNTKTILKPSEWCYRQWELALERGNELDANNYMNMYNMWKERGQ